MDSIRILEKLIAFPTVSRDSNLDADRLRARACWRRSGIECRSSAADATGQKANLYATIGPADRPASCCRAIPTSSRSTARTGPPPFRADRARRPALRPRPADMKGFVACALAAALGRRSAARHALHLALSYDEEVGCIGVRSLIDMLAALRRSGRALCIVGEPTSMAVATGHKGKLAARADLHSAAAGHSALAPLALNALHLACDFVAAICAEAGRLRRSGAARRRLRYSLHDAARRADRMAAWRSTSCRTSARSTSRSAISPSRRSARQSSPRSARRRHGIAAAAQRCARSGDRDRDDQRLSRARHPGGRRRRSPSSRSLTGANGRSRLPSAPKADCSADDLGMPTVVCGPGSMAQGHRPDEFVSVEQMRRCDDMLDNLLRLLASHRLQTA